MAENELWKWKVNALNFMGNNYQEKSKPCIVSAYENKNDKIREMLNWYVVNDISKNFLTMRYSMI